MPEGRGFSGGFLRRLAYRLHFTGAALVGGTIFVALSLLVLGAAVYLTHHQRRIIELHRELTILREDSDKLIRQHTTRLFALSSINRMISVETDLQKVFGRCWACATGASGRVVTRNSSRPGTGSQSAG